MKIQSISHHLTHHKNYQLSNKANMHIIDGFLHADTMEHFAKAALKKEGIVSEIWMHHVNCNSRDINTKQMGNVELVLKNISNKLKNGDFLIIPGLASVPILNLKDRIKNVLNLDTRLTPQTLKAYNGVLFNYLREIYTYPNYYRNDINALDRNNQELEYTYGVINEINHLRKKGVNVYLPAGHGADETLKWLIKNNGYGNELYRYISIGQDTDHCIKNCLQRAENNNYYDFNLLSLSDAHIVNVKDMQNRDFIFSAKDGFVNDSARGVYNFTPVRGYNGSILGYSFHDETSVEYPYPEFHANKQIANLCKYVGLTRGDFLPSKDEIQKFKEYIKRGYSTSELSDKLYDLSDVYDYSEIKQKKLDILGCLVNKDGLIFDMTPLGKIIFQKTNCEGSCKPSVLQMWGSCFSSINAAIRDMKKVQQTSISSTRSVSFYTKNAEKSRNASEYKTAEHYYNQALDILHPDKTSLEHQNGAIEIYEKLYSLLKSQNKNTAAKGIANMIINLKSYKIKDKSVWSSQYQKIQREISVYYIDMSNFCLKDDEFYPAQVCRWAANELFNSTSYGDKIIQRRAEQNQYIGDLYDECH